MYLLMTGCSIGYENSPPLLKGSCITVEFLKDVSWLPSLESTSVDGGARCIYSNRNHSKKTIQEGCVLGDTNRPLWTYRFHIDVARRDHTCEEKRFAIFDDSSWGLVRNINLNGVTRSQE